MRGYGRFAAINIGAIAALGILAPPSPSVSITPVPATEEQQVSRKKSRRHQAPKVQERSLQCKPLNRSKRWATAYDYGHARKISPVPDEPVR